MANTDNWFYRLFINEAKAVLHRCSCSSGDQSGSDESIDIEADVQAEINGEQYAIDNAAVNAETTVAGMYNVVIID